MTFDIFPHSLCARLTILATCAALAQAAPKRATAQSPDARLQAIEQTVSSQQREIATLRSQLASQQAAVARMARLPQVVPAVSQGAAPANPGKMPAGDKSKVSDGKDKAGDKKKLDDGWKDMSAEKWTIKLGGHMQADYIQWAHADAPIPAQNYFEFRRLRLLAEGTGYGVYDFRLQIDIEPEAEDPVTTPVTVIKDAYLTMNEVAGLQRVRFGNFFVPFGLEQVTNDTNNIFMERSIPTQGIFCADREVGVASYGVSDDKNATWTFGAFFDSISEGLKERIDDNQGYRLSSRFTWLPYYDEPSNGRYLVHTGVGFLYTDDQDDLVRFRARPQIHEGPFLIDSGNLSASTFYSANVELATVWGPFSVQSELYATNVNMTTGDNVTLYGAYVYGSYFLTGENRIYERYGQHGAQFGRNVPYTNFFLVPGCAGWGAWEAKVRMSYLDLNPVGEGQYTDLTAGLNWYWTDRIRIMFDWIHPGTTADTVFGAHTSDVIAMRFDYNF